MQYFGMNIDYGLGRWVRNVLGPSVVNKYGKDTAFVAVILPTSARVGGDVDELMEQAIVISYGHVKEGPQGLQENVLHKLQWCLRTGMNSAEANYHPELLEEGDYPYEGAGCHRGFWGGVSGLHEESDWWVFKQIVDQLIGMRLSASSMPRRVGLPTPRPAPEIRSTWSLNCHRSPSDTPYPARRGLSETPRSRQRRGVSFL